MFAHIWNAEPGKSPGALKFVVALRGNAVSSPENTVKNVWIGRIWKVWIINHVFISNGYDMPNDTFNEIGLRVVRREPFMAQTEMRLRSLHMLHRPTIICIHCGLIAKMANRPLAVEEESRFAIVTLFAHN